MRAEVALAAVLIAVPGIAHAQGLVLSAESFPAGRGAVEVSLAWENEGLSAIALDGLAISFDGPLLEARPGGFPPMCTLGEENLGVYCDLSATSDVPPGFGGGISLEVGGTDADYVGDVEIAVTLSGSDATMGFAEAVAQTSVPVADIALTVVEHTGNGRVEVAVQNLGPSDVRVTDVRVLSGLTQFGTSDVLFVGDSVAIEVSTSDFPLEIYLGGLDPNLANNRVDGPPLTDSGGGGYTIYGCAAMKASLPLLLPGLVFLRRRRRVG